MTQKTTDKSDYRGCDLETTSIVLLSDFARNPFFQQLYNTIDTVIVGQFVGKAALASVGGSSAQIVALIVGFFTGLSSGASVLIAQYFGARNEHAASDGLHNAYAISIVGGILLGIIGFCATPFMLRLMNTPG